MAVPPETRLERRVVEIQRSADLFHGVKLVAPIKLKKSEPIIKKTEVEQTVLKDLGDMSIKIDIGDVVAGVWMPPRRRDSCAVLCLKKPDQGDLPR